MLTTYTYDDRGRLVLIEQDGGCCYEGSGAPAVDGEPDYVEQKIYAADGSALVQIFDFITDEVVDV